MKNLVILTLLATVFTVGRSEAQVSKSLTKSFNLDGVASVSIQLDGQSKTQEWEGNFIRVFTEIEIANTSENILKKLIEAGRYTLVGTNKDGVLEVSCPNLRKKVATGGKDLEESVKFTVMIPKGMNFTLVGDTLSQSGSSTPGL